MEHKVLRTTFSLLIALALLAAIAMPAAAGKPQTVEVQILAINDFHGNLEPPAGSSGRITLPGGATVNAGGAEFLSTHIQQLRATNPNTIFLSAGDSIGASPLLSALFHDEPTIEALNMMGMEYSAVGNHEFDEGVDELLRMQNGGCHPVDGCQDGDDFAGAAFQYLTANVEWKDRHKPKTLFPPVKIRTFKKAKVAFIGVSLESTPTIVTPSGVAGLNFLPEVASVNALVPLLQAKGVRAIVVVLHNGGSQTGFYNECVNLSSDITGIAEGLDDEVDVLITGHTHNAYNCVVDNKLVTGASSFGRLITDIDLTIDRGTGDVVAKQANNVIVTRDVPADPAVTALINKYKVVAGPLANRVIGSITADITRTATAAGESALGDVIADAQLAATALPGYGDAVVAFMNPGGIRADLTYNQISGGELPGEVTYGEAFTVQPFGNSLVTMSLTGAQIDTLLEQQFDNPLPGQMRILQVSQGFTYTWSASAPTGNKVDIASIMINGVPIDPAGVYRVTVNSFLADGGDRFTVLTQGTDRLGGALDLDALIAYFAAYSPVPPGPMDRISMIP
ncbi:MAG: bifunctional metallophosphatase/5'-nucleotidase [Anaerolineales bacterium]|nr:bifunctional metallophosphatase/5'-nucleotidase [Anaerolineales bacterium]